MTNESTAAVAENTENDFLDDVVGKETEETVPDKQPEKDDKEPEKKVLVPHGAFHEERERRKELQKQLAEEKSARERLEERQTKVLEALAARQQPQQEEQFVDPLAKIEGKVNEVVDKINKTQTQREADEKEIRETNALLQRYSASAQAFTKDAPDFSDAYNFLLGNRQKELGLMGFTPAEVQAQLRAEEKLIVTRAYDGEKNPAEVIYSLAKERGYKSTGSSKKSVEDIDKGLKASKTLGSGGAKAGDKDDLESLTASELAEMSQEEFDSFFSKLEKQASRKH